MNVNPINNNQTFEGKVLKVNSIIGKPKELYQFYKSDLEDLIHDLPFDLLVKQNHNSKIILITTNIDGAKSFVVKKGKSFIGAANDAIKDALSKSELYKKMFEYKKAVIIYPLMGKIKQAKEAHIELAKLAKDNFGLYAAIPQMRVNAPLDAMLIAPFNIITKMIYNLSKGNSSEEKQLARMEKEYIKRLKANYKTREEIEIDFPAEPYEVFGIK